MTALLNQPIVADYVPAARPPWVLLALAFAIFASLLPRDMIPVLIALTAVVVAVGLVANVVYARFRNEAARPSCGVHGEDREG